MKRRGEKNKDKMKRQQGLSEHPFGTIKRAFNQGYMLMKGEDKVGAEMSLTVLAYNIKKDNEYSWNQRIDCSSSIVRL
ncbi:MAG TPA: hypothetical protein ENH28_05505 [Euryarchaeota archaeon]|nr:hypothetical protein BMS3Bbin15_00166 [archaeon BMS3Bbin15]HDL15587.1 hypothetical protein [Euryarchaeota archaeon]